MIAHINEPLATDQSAGTLPPAVAKRVSGTEASFAETALKLGGKSDEEVRRTGAMDKADDQVESLFARQHQTASSPIHRAVWDRAVPVELFSPQMETFSPVPSAPSSGERARVRGRSSETAATPTVMRDSLSVVEDHLIQGSLYDEQGKFHNEVLHNLGHAGYWGLLVDRAYGGSS